MSSKQIMFFITKSDIERILKEIEEAFDIQYFLMGLFDSPDIVHYNSIFDDPRIGLTSFGDWNLIDRYLIIPKNIALDIREVEQRKGGIKYAVDLLNNPKGIELKLGGVYTEKDGVIVGGRVGVTSNDPFSLDFYNSFSKKVKKEFKRIGTSYVGKGTEEKLDAGWRLVTSINSPEAYDLVKS